MKTFKTFLLLIAVCGVCTAPIQATPPAKDFSSNPLDLQKALKAHPNAAMLNPWEDLLFIENVDAQKLMQAQDMLKPENLKRLGMHDLREQLCNMNKPKRALYFSAHAAEIFTDQMDSGTQMAVIKPIFASLRPLPEIMQILTAASACFTPTMNGRDQVYILNAALGSPRPISEIGRPLMCVLTPLFDGCDHITQTYLIAQALKSQYPLHALEENQLKVKLSNLLNGFKGEERGCIVGLTITLSPPLLDRLKKEWESTEARGELQNLDEAERLTLMQQKVSMIMGTNTAS